MNKPKVKTRPEEIDQRRDEAIRKALRTPPTHLKDMKKKPKPKATVSSKRDGA